MRVRCGAAPPGRRRGGPALRARLHACRSPDGTRIAIADRIAVRERLTRDGVGDRDPTRPVGLPTLELRLPCVHIGARPCGGHGVAVLAGARRDRPDSADTSHATRRAASAESRDRVRVSGSATPRREQSPGLDTST